MLDRLGPWLVWALFLGAVWLFAKPVLILLAGVGIVILVVLGVLRKLEAQGEEVARGWRKDQK